uniref:Shootin-1 n=1 Tax=Xenopus tropicalis TaxID=8364 RepID=A0A1B8Y4B3_XENTR
MLYPTGNAGDLKRMAVEEMMDRIKRGVPLRPVNSASRIKKPQVPNDSNAVQELKEILKTFSTDSTKKEKDVSNPHKESELERILRRRKATTEQDGSNPTGALTSLESKSMPILGTASSPSLSHRRKEAEIKCRGNTAEGPLLFKDKKESAKVSSQSAEALSDAGKEAKQDGASTGLNFGLNSAEKADSLQRVPTENGALAAGRMKETDSSNC